MRHKFSCTYQYIKITYELNNDVMKKTSVFLSVLVAAGAGIIIGVLLAPNSGVRTRRKILFLGEEALEELEQAIEDSFDDLKR
jgi:gas vesicle protein